MKTISKSGTRQETLYSGHNLTASPQVFFLCGRIPFVFFSSIFLVKTATMILFFLFGRYMLLLYHLLSFFFPFFLK